MLLGWVSVVAVLAGSVLAMAQHDVRRMLAYSSVGQMGYIVLGMALGTPAALIGALLHLFSHAVMKGCLFLVVGGIRWRTGIYRISDYAGMGRRMPLTMAAFVGRGAGHDRVAADLGILQQVVSAQAAPSRAGAWLFVVALVLSSLLGVVYFFRVFEVAYLKAPEAGQGTPPRQELPLHMLAPILVLMAAVLVFGLLNQQVVGGIIRHALPGALAP